MKKSLALGALFVAAHGYTNTSPRKKKTNKQTTNQHGNIVLLSLIKWLRGMKSTVYPPTHLEAHSSAISRTKYQFLFFGGGMEGCISHRFMSQRTGR